MKVDMDAHGNIVLVPESFTEQYALKAWVEKNLVPVRNTALEMPTHYFKESAIKIVTLE